MTCEATDTLDVVARKMTDEHVGAFAVLDGNRILGIISERDLVRAVAEGADPAVTKAGVLASRQVETARLDEDIADVARRMLDAGIRHLPVLRERLVVGVVSMRDLLAVETRL
ncbi:putative signal-transduction protein with CBS domains [Saccharopolyspora erythraea NRRL 2338]|uniref:Signal-transduction protein with CBS domains n=1 Tax=Saccharopolyspora erythraea (strain ATCC 11635 / DSM 40517 / JCM 4748 / NBRC 13426 / NCIMB 8594 / NRRL 2338) TaxID=405948 RepID=A4FCE1_SACEN|nr:signal transduction protein [Saccharopolyspora erythraea D]CAM01716.1 putative signal-transduction protein with CBS domains [Saccharopolyspora erythraea NRRL 2338]